MEFFKAEDFRGITSVKLESIESKFIKTDEVVETANRILEERGVRVHGYSGAWGDPVSWRTHVINPIKSNYTHSALLINIESIKKETAEDLLRELVNELEAPYQTRGGHPRLSTVATRARSLLDSLDKSGK